MDIAKQAHPGVADEICSPGFAIHGPGLPSELQRGRDGVKRYATMLRTAFPDDLEIRHKVVIPW